MRETEAVEQQYLMILDISVALLQENQEVRIFIGHIIKIVGREQSSGYSLA